jgi:hypothetical protein
VTASWKPPASNARVTASNPREEQATRRRDVGHLAEEDSFGLADKSGVGSILPCRARRETPLSIWDRRERLSNEPSNTISIQEEQ